MRPDPAADPAIDPAIDPAAHSTADAHASGSAAPTVVIGLTGPIGCGKSTVAAWLGELGAAVVDADLVAREVTQPGEPTLDAVLEAFGPGVRALDGSLDRAALGRIVFSDPEALARLEAIVHPAVRPRILDAITAATRDGVPAVAVEAIKLVEGGLAALCDEVWLLVCDPAAQRERLAARTPDATDTEARIAAQADIVERLLPSATRVIDTSGTLDETRALVRAAFVEAVSAAVSAANAGPSPAASSMPPPSPRSSGL